MRRVGGAERWGLTRGDSISGGFTFPVWSPSVMTRWFPFSGFGCRVSGFKVSCFGSRVSRFRVSGLGFQGFGFRDSDFKNSGFGQKFTCPPAPSSPRAEMRWSGCGSHPDSPLRERDFFIDNLLVRIQMIDGPALRHGSLNSPFQVALHLPF